MRTEEIHSLRNENVRWEEKLEEYDTMKIEWRKATAQAEDLKEQLNSKLDLERYESCVLKNFHLNSIIFLSCIIIKFVNITNFTIFRKLSAENRKLFTTVEKESSEKKRLSMENEELHWKIRQSMDQSYGANASGLLSMSVIEGTVCCRTFIFIVCIRRLKDVLSLQYFGIFHYTYFQKMCYQIVECL